MIRQVRREVGARVTLIGVGGIKDGGSAREKLDAGADLIQIYTGLVYRGPGIIPSILRSIEEGQQG